MVVGLASLGRGRLQRMGSGSGKRPRVKALPSQVKAEVVYSADWRPRFFLNVGYLARPSKKFLKALSRCRKACWGGTLESSFNQPNSGCLLSPVRAALVSRYDTCSPRSG